jgi:hypothetical protein
MAKIHPDVIEWKQTSAGPWGVGTTLRETRSRTPKTQDFRVTEYEPNQKLTVAITSGPIRGTRITEKMENIEGKTKLTETAEYHFSGFYKVLRPFVGLSRTGGEARVCLMKSVLESEAKS